MHVARIIDAEVAQGTRHPARVMRLDVGLLGELTSVGQFALVQAVDLVGRNVVVCVNLGTREMGPYISEALVLGAPHPDSTNEQAQATPLYVADAVRPGSPIF